MIERVEGPQGARGAVCMMLTSLGLCFHFHKQRASLQHEAAVVRCLHMVRSAVCTAPSATT